MEYVVTIAAIAALAYFVFRAIRKSSAGAGGGSGIKLERDNNVER